MPKVSVVMSVYNGEMYLSEAIESIRQQTLPDWEFVIIEDGSTDNTLSILEAYAQQDARIVLVRNEKNLGLQRSLNKGLAVSRGEYIARLDADDVSLPERLQVQVEYLAAHPQIGLLGTAVEMIDEQGNPHYTPNFPADHDSLHALLLFDNCLHHSSVMFRRSVVEQVGGYDETKRYVEDYDLWWRLSRVTQIANLPNVLVRRRYRDESISWRYRAPMLKAAMELSLAAVSESLNGEALDREAYKRFWWTYYSQRTQLPEAQLELQAGDIKRLQAFWQLLASHPAGTRIWGPRLQDLAYRLFRHRRYTVEAMQLLWVVKNYLSTPIVWSSTLKKLIKPYIPNAGQQMWKNWQLKQTET